MWILVVAAASAFSMNTSSLDDCVQTFESIRPPQVEEAYCMDIDANRVWLVPPPSLRENDRAPPLPGLSESGLIPT